MRLRLGMPTALLWTAAGLGGCAALRSRPSNAIAHCGEFFPLHPGTFWLHEVRAEGRVALERERVRGVYKALETDGTVVEESGGTSSEFDLDVSRHPVTYYRRGPFLDKFLRLNYDVGGELLQLSLGEEGEDVPPADSNEHREWESDFDIFRGHD